MKKESILELADGTRTAREIAEMVGCSAAYVRHVACGMLTLTRPATSQVERNRDILRMRKQGHSYGEIGLRFGISRQRVHMILKRAAERGEI